MTDDEAKEAILARLTARPVTVDMVQAAASEVLADDANRANFFDKWIKTQGPALCARLNK